MFDWVQNTHLNYTISLRYYSSFPHLMQFFIWTKDMSLYSYNFDLKLENISSGIMKSRLCCSSMIKFSAWFHFDFSYQIKVNERIKINLYLYKKKIDRYPQSLHRIEGTSAHICIIHHTHIYHIHPRLNDTSLQFCTDYLCFGNLILKSI